MIASYLLAILLAYPAPDDAPPFPTAEPSAVGIDPTALERLKVRAAKAKSDAVLIVKDGKLIADWTFDKNTMQPGGLPTGQDGRVVRNKSPSSRITVSGTTTGTPGSLSTSEVPTASGR